MVDLAHPLFRLENSFVEHRRGDFWLGQFPEVRGNSNLNWGLRLKTDKAKSVFWMLNHGWAVALGSVERHAPRVVQNHCEPVDNAVKGWSG